MVGAEPNLRLGAKLFSLADLLFAEKILIAISLELPQKVD